jgi:hypothetical protein
MSSSDSALMAGFWFGNLLYLGVLALIFWFVGRWSSIGLVIRIVVVALFLWRILQLAALMNLGG